MGSELIILLVFGAPFLILCLIYAVRALHRRRRGKPRCRADSAPRLYISQQVPSVFDTFKGGKK